MIIMVNCIIKGGGEVEAGFLAMNTLKNPLVIILCLGIVSFLLYLLVRVIIHMVKCSKSAGGFATCFAKKFKDKFKNWFKF